MLEQLKLLEELQKADLGLQETEEALQSLPVRLKSMQKDVDSVEGLLDGERGQLEEVQRYRAELEQAIRNDQAQLNKAKAKLTQVRTSKEYMAIQREFETNRRLVGEREQEMVKLDQAIEQTKKSIEKHEQELAELRNHVAEEARDTELKLQQLRDSVEEQRGVREVTAGRVKKQLLRKYDQIRRLRGGVAVVQAEGGVCTGCRMHLPPQLYNLLQRFDSVEQCPTCQRIVYFEREEGEGDTQAAEAGDTSSPSTDAETTTAD